MREEIMLEIQKLQAIALAGGFRKTRVSGDGSATWLCKSSDCTGNGDTRICIDEVTRSATAFRTTERKVLDSKTFRKAQDLKAWLDLA
jgi:hypothetical protein